MHPRRRPVLGDRVIYVDEQGREFAAIVASAYEDKTRASVLNLGAFDHDGTPFPVQAVPFDTEYGYDPYGAAFGSPGSGQARRRTCHWPSEPGS